MRNTYPYQVTRLEDGRQQITLPQFTLASETLPADASEDAVHKAACRLVCTSIKVLMDERAEVPGGSELTKLPGHGFACIDWPITVKILLYHELIRSGVSENAFAGRLRIPQTSLQRLLDPFHESRWSSFESALQALNLELDYDFEVVPTERMRPLAA